MKEYIRKADIILLIALIAAGLAASAALALSGSGAGSKVVIKTGGELYATYPLHEDRTIVVPAPGAKKTGDAGAADQADPANQAEPAGKANASDTADQANQADPTEKANQTGQAADVLYDSYNIVEIKDGKVSVTEGSCKNQVCVRHAPVSAPGESIICLPNRLTVYIEGAGVGGSEEGGGYDTVTS